MKLGIAGHLTRAFIGSALTPLFLLAAFAVGLVALVTLPREEEPQISVPMVDIHVSAPGLKAEDAEKLITEPLETIVKAINGVEHVYSFTQDDAVLVTARFLVAVARTAVARSDGATGALIGATGVVGVAPGAAPGVVGTIRGRIMIVGAEKCVVDPQSSPVDPPLVVF